MPQSRSIVEEQKQGSQDIIQVFLRLHNGNGCMLSVSKFITLFQFKKIVSETQLEIPSQFQLVFQGKSMCKANAALNSLGVVNGSIIHIDNCQIQGPPKLKLDVCFFYEGEKVVIRAGREQTIMSLKTKIYRLIGILPKNQMLIFRGTRLEDDQTLAFYHIAEDSLLCLHTNPQLQETIKSETPFNEKRELILATVSVNFTRDHANNNSKMFRSESMGIEKEPYEIQIREDNKEELIESKDFKFELFNPMPTIQASDSSENLSNQQNKSNLEYKILVNAREFVRNQLMII